MNADTIQARYDELDRVAARFGKASAASAELNRRITRCVEVLERGGWQGRGADAFFAEMHGTLYPAMQRLVKALDDGRATTLQVKELLRAAEEEASRVFQGGLSFSALGVSAASAGVANDLPSVAAALAGQGGFAPFPLWLTAPFVAGAAIFGPVPIPILGPWGRVPSGYSNAGSRLWLYLGGSGTDTIFSIHPQAGWGRAPKGLPKPNLRLDYGFINVRSGTAYLPNETAVSVPPYTNFFHWNQQGGQGIGGDNPLFRSFGEAVSHDHQLLTNNPLPKGNILGGIKGAEFVRGASKGLFIVGAGLDIYNVATADNKVREATRVAGGWTGGWAGAEGGAMAGAAIGSFFGPGPGTAIGGVIGGIIGGIGGYMGGSKVGEVAYDAANK